MSAIDCVVTDLDGTVYNTQHREYLAPLEKFTGSNWIEYCKACKGDTPVAGMVAALQIHANNGLPIFLVSGRREEARAETIWRLNEDSVPFFELRLHSDNDIRHNGEYKVDYIEQLKARGYNPVLMYEDIVTVAQMIETQTGVPVVTIKPHYEDLITVSLNNLAPEES